MCVRYRQFFCDVPSKERTGAVHGRKCNALPVLWRPLAAKAKTLARCPYMDLGA